MNTEEALPDEMLMDPVATGCKIKTPCCDNRVFNKMTVMRFDVSNRFSFGSHRC